MAVQVTGEERSDEDHRKAVLAAHRVDGLRSSAELRRLTDFAARLCGAPSAMISLVEESRQRFLVSSGIDIDETPRSMSFCAQAMLRDGLTVIPDAAADPRFADNGLVTGPLAVRFYAGAPLVADDGTPLGALCVVDTRPHPDGLNDDQREGLLVLAEAVMARFRDTRDAARWRTAEHNARRAADDSDTRFRTLADTMPQMVWSTLPDGYHDYYNARWYEFTGMPEGSTDGEEWNGMFHPEDQDRAWSVWRHSLTTGDPYQIEYRLRHHDGTYRWVLGRALPIRDPSGAIQRWFGTCTDIHAQKLALDEREVISQELSHRIKNIFAVISGLIAFAARSKPEFATIAADLRDRITALGRAHDFVRPHSPRSRPSAQQDSLKGLLDELFEPYAVGGHGRIAVTGDDVAIDDRSATPLALLFHELATNATKYGALSNDGGHIVLDIAQRQDTVELLWREEGGPAVMPPASAGFGTQLIDLAGVRQLGGTVERTWPETGMTALIRIPLPALSRQV